MVKVYVVGMRDDAPEAVFSTLEKAQATMPPHLWRDMIIGPYVLDDPDAELPNWWETEAAKP